MQNYNPLDCKERLSKLGLVACENLAVNCQDVYISSSYHQVCAGSDLYTPVQVLTCQSYGGSTKGQMIYYPSEQFFQKCSEKASSDPNGKWSPGFCYCCCVGNISNNLILIPNGSTPSKQLATGQEVTTIALHRPGAKLELSTGQIDFAQGIEGTLQQLVYLIYGEKAEYQTVCPPEQPFLLDSRKLITAGKLVLGLMNLVNSAGNALPIRLAGIGKYNIDTFQIGLKSELNDSPSNHLIVSNGAVIGDYKLQLNFNNIPNEWKIEEYENLATMGSSEYLKQNKNLKPIPYDEVFSSLDKNTIGNIVFPVKDSFQAYSFY